VDEAGKREMQSVRPNAVRRVIRSLGRLGLIGLLPVVCVRVTGLAESMFYWPSQRQVVTPVWYEDVQITTPDGVQLHGWFMPAQGVESGQRAPAILHAHGNAGTVESHESFSRFLAEAGFHVLLFDYRGYGRSESRGRPNRDRLTMDTQAALDSLLARDDVDADRVGVLGVSLGAAFALRVAAEDQRVRSVATLSAFSSWWRAANDAAPGLGWLLIPRGVEPEQSAARLGDRPLLIMHGMADDIVGPHHAQRLLSSARSGGVASERWTHPDAGHNDLVQSYREPRDVLIDFYRRTLDAPRD
jgi:uncharacterized protein